MTTSEFIDFMLDMSGNTVSRPTMLTLINIAQNEVASVDSDFFKTKPEPFLATTSGVFTYTLASNIRRVSRLYGLATNKNFDLAQTSYGGFAGAGDYRGPRFDNITAGPEIKVPVHTIDSSSPDSGDCQIIFPTENDPGTTTDVFIIDQYEWPTQLTAETVDIAIPEGFQTTLLYYKVSRLLEEREFKNSIYNEKKEKEFMKKWLASATKAASIEEDVTMPRSV